MGVQNFVSHYFETDGEWVVWDEYCKTMYEPFVGDMFGEVIQSGIDAEKKPEDIIRGMIMRSITQNYGLTEYIIRQTGISLF